MGVTLSSETFRYDKAGNRIEYEQGSRVYVSSSNANNELLVVAPSPLAAGEGGDEGGRIFEYDPNGNTVKEMKEGTTTYFRYDGDNRLVEVVVASTQCVVTSTYHYDPFGRRISKCVDGTTTYFVYSDEGLIAEYDGSGTATVEYGWQPDGVWGTNPVFQKRDGAYYWYHNDHLGTPQKMTDASGAVVWSATYEAFGKATVSPTSPIENNLRFPGQYRDRETGLHQNWHRDYNSMIGKYTTMDPLFSLGNHASKYRGFNLRGFLIFHPDRLYVYNYGKGNPITYFDSAGLACGTDANDPYVPDNFWFWNFTGACEGHDRCYGNCTKDAVSKASCDVQFLRDMTSACINAPTPATIPLCLDTALTYYLFVKYVGDDAFRDARNKCKCK